MRNQKIYRTISFIYLSIVPVLTALLGFTVDQVSYKIYLPLWIINAILMLVALWILAFRNAPGPNKHLIAGGVLLSSPWIFYSIFAGLGSPPGTYAGWVSDLFQQQIRYSFLIIGGILMMLGFALVKESVKNSRGSIFSVIGSTALIIATPLFFINMSYWHSFLPETFKIPEVSSLNKLPEWFSPIKKIFLVVAIVEVSLTYLATAAFVTALNSARLFRKIPSSIYIIISLLAFLFVAFYGFYPDAIIANGFPFYPFMIPAIPFVLPFYIGINLLRLRTGLD